MAILKILKHTGIVIIISVVWMLIVSYFWHKDSSQMVMYWIIGTIVFGWIYLRYAEKKRRFNLILNIVSAHFQRNLFRSPPPIQT